MRERTNAEWIVAKKEDGLGVIHCLRCGDRYEINMPCALTVYLATINGYLQVHGHCKEPK